MSTAIVAADALTQGVAEAAALLAGRRMVVLTGAGISTDSGIPDYRGPDSPRHTPMTIAQFRSGPAARQRYWARSHLGWERMRRAEPNGGHRALAEIQAATGSNTVSDAAANQGRRDEVAGPMSGTPSEQSGTVIITQNVDGLHQAAGSNPVIDLHGRLDTVVCLTCGARSSRAELQRRLSDLNPGFGYDAVRGAAAVRPDDTAVMRPDGDAEVGDTGSFVVADCLICGGVLKPDVVFFGENVPAHTVRASYDAVGRAEAMLVAGSSLTVMSGLRFVKRAAAQGIPIVIVNRGVTRGDDLATLRVDAGCTPFLSALAAELA